MPVSILNWFLMQIFVACDAILSHYGTLKISKGKEFILHDNIIQGQSTEHNAIGQVTLNCDKTTSQLRQFGVKVGSETSANRLKDAHKNYNFMFRRDHVILSFQNSQTLQFFIFVTFCAFQAVFASMYRSFLYKIAWPKWWWQLEFPKLYSWYWHVVGLWKVSILTVENSSIDCCSRLSSLDRRVWWHRHE